MDEELELERNSRSKAEKSRQVLNRELEDIAAKLEESGLKKSLLPIQFEVKWKRLFRVYFEFLNDMFFNASLLDNAPNNLAGCVIQKRLMIR